jgi:hypothetical protein
VLHCHLLYSHVFYLLINFNNYNFK